MLMNNGSATMNNEQNNLSGTIICYEQYSIKVVVSLMILWTEMSYYFVSY